MTTWMGLLLAILFVVFSLVLFTLWIWPRDSDGDLLPPEEAEQVMERRVNELVLEKAPWLAGHGVELVLIVSFAALAAALSNRNSDKDADLDP